MHGRHMSKREQKERREGKDLITYCDNCNKITDLV